VQVVDIVCSILETTLLSAISPRVVIVRYLFLTSTLSCLSSLSHNPSLMILSLIVLDRIVMGYIHDLEDMLDPVKGALGHSGIRAALGGSIGNERCVRA
jgi:hypothetical protein